MTDRTTDELRDRLARLKGWSPTYAGCVNEWNGPGGEYMNGHPFPAGDLTALAAAWPEEWGFTLFGANDGKPWMVIAAKKSDGPDGVSIYSDGFNVAAPTEYEARLRLTVAVLEAKAAEVEA